MTDLELMNSNSVDRCWAFNAEPRTCGWTIDRRIDHLVIHLEMHNETAKCQTLRYYLSNGGRTEGDRRGRVHRHGLLPGEKAPHKFTRVNF